MSLELLRAAFEERLHHASPFLVLGDPTPELSVEIAVSAVEAGASMLELGIPYSDPCADGPAVQAACQRAFAGGVSTSVALDALSRIHDRSPSVPKNLLVYGNLVHARGVERFCADAADAGASSLLVPDIPPGEDAGLARACAKHGLGHVLLVAPATAPARLARLDEAATGFLYLAAYQGVTGRGAPRMDASTLARVAQAVRNPVCLGFGLSQPTDLESAFAGGARLCVVGSHLCRAIESAWEAAPSDRKNTNETTRRVLRTFLDAWRPLARVTDTDCASREAPTPKI